ncbi:hypothetical protein OC845_005003 [Tilletia horrida]|nr:hypothetical protein OC845_005003 [Tilletia horrida]
MASSRLCWLLLLTFVSLSSLTSAYTCTQSYSVVSGATCDGICRRNSVSGYQLQKLNSGLDCSSLKVGQSLCLRSKEYDCTAVYTVAGGDTCYSIATAKGISSTQLSNDNPGLSCGSIYAGQVLCVSATTPGSSTTKATTTTRATSASSTSKASTASATAPATTAAACSNYSTVQSGDTCDKICARSKVSLYNLQALNSKTASFCSSLQAGAGVCVDGASNNCSRVHTVVSDQSCNDIASKYSTTFASLRALNPNIDSGCSNIYAGEVLCVKPRQAAPSWWQKCTSSYTVVLGDTCNKIAAKLSQTSTQLLGLNPGLSCSTLKVDQVICGFRPSATVCPKPVFIKSNDTCYNLAVKVGMSLPEWQSLNTFNNVSVQCNALPIGNIVCQQQGNASFPALSGSNPGSVPLCSTCDKTTSCCTKYSVCAPLWSDYCTRNNTCQSNCQGDSGVVVPPRPKKGVGAGCLFNCLDFVYPSEDTNPNGNITTVVVQQPFANKTTIQTRDHGAVWPEPGGVRADDTVTQRSEVHSAAAETEGDAHLSDELPLPLFQLVDQDADGYITLDELESVAAISWGSPEAAYNARKALSLPDFVDFIHTLDRDGDEKISVSEFAGLRRPAKRKSRDACIDFKAKAETCQSKHVLSCAAYFSAVQATCRNGHDNLVQRCIENYACEDICSCIRSVEKAALSQMDLRSSDSKQSVNNQLQVIRGAPHRQDLGHHNAHHKRHVVQSSAASPEPATLSARESMDTLAGITFAGAARAVASSTWDAGAYTKSPAACSDLCNADSACVLFEIPPLAADHGSPQCLLKNSTGLAVTLTGSTAFIKKVAAGACPTTSYFPGTVLGDDWSLDNTAEFGRRDSVESDKEGAGPLARATFNPFALQIRQSGKVPSTFASPLGPNYATLALLLLWAYSRQQPNLIGDPIFEDFRERQANQNLVWPTHRFTNINVQNFPQVTNTNAGGWNWVEVTRRLVNAFRRFVSDGSELNSVPESSTAGSLDTRIVTPQLRTVLSNNRDQIRSLGTRTWLYRGSSRGARPPAPGVQVVQANNAAFFTTGGVGPLSLEAAFTMALQVAGVNFEEVNAAYQRAEGFVTGGSPAGDFTAHMVTGNIGQETTCIPATFGTDRRGNPRYLGEQRGMGRIVQMEGAADQGNGNGFYLTFNLDPDQPRSPDNNLLVFAVHTTDEEARVWFTDDNAMLQTPIFTTYDASANLPQDGSSRARRVVRTLAHAHVGVITQRALDSYVTTGAVDRSDRGFPSYDQIGSFHFFLNPEEAATDPRQQYRDAERSQQP